MPIIDPNKQEVEEVKREEVAEINEIKSEPIDSIAAKADLITESILDEVLKSIEKGLFPKRQPRDGRVSLIEKPRQRGIKTILWSVEGYVDEIFREIMEDPGRFIASLSVPLNRDSLFILGQIQNEDNDYFETIEQIMTQPVLSVDLYLDLERKRKVDSIDEVPEDARHEALLTEWSNIHNKCIFDAVNDALDYYRPYGLKGPPLPWSKQVRELTYRNGSVASIQDILLGAKAKALSWAMVNAGTLQLPDEFDLAAILSQLGINKSNGDKSKLDQYREERLEMMLSTEVVCACY